MNREKQLFFVFLQDAEGKPATGFVGVYVDDPDSARQHAERSGGFVLSVVGTEVE